MIRVDLPAWRRGGACRCQRWEGSAGGYRCGCWMFVAADETSSLVRHREVFWIWLGGATRPEIYMRLIVPGTCLHGATATRRWEPVLQYWRLGMPRDAPVCYCIMIISRDLEKSTRRGDPSARYEKSGHST